MGRLVAGIKAMLGVLGNQCRCCERMIPVKGECLLWCSECFSFYEDSKARCSCCGLVFGEDSLTSRPVMCGECLNKPPNWDKLYCVGDYGGALKSDLYKLKYKHDYHIAREYGQLMVRRVGALKSSELPTVLVVVPVPWLRYWRRGYNQSQLLARSVREHFAVKGVNVSIVCPFGRQYRWRGHTRLNRKQRLSHSQSEFYIKSTQIEPLRQHSHVAIVDDVVTTGATIQQLSSLLLENGVSRIDIYCVGRTAKPAKSR
ncbi:ComF family protein [Vibrio ulleungensis]|uniref:ComF family protein n=1 Tax=Vibrio ulleungensis TaxID=2807619 RepID=A0ABS2HJH8_9VIBR|nr:ComF family protein [Vibrio ulleungensis]MBM7037663.1 ComF family protein [Vibrio ulleungensis]